MKIVVMTQNKDTYMRKLWSTFFQLIKFSIVGLLNTLISYVIFAILIRLHIHYIFANAVGFFASVINAFYWNKQWVFYKGSNENRYFLKEFLKCVASYSINSLFLTSLLLYIWIHIYGISPYLGQAINLCITIPLNFLVNKFWIFK